MFLLNMAKSLRNTGSHFIIPTQERQHCGNDRRGVLHTPYITIDDKPRESNTPPRSPSQTLGAIVRGYKSSVTKQLGLMGFKGKLWQGNYYEHIIRNEYSYQTLSEYVINNPLKWIDDKFYMP